MKIARSPALVISGLAAALALAGCSSGAASTGAQQHPAASSSVQWMPTPDLPTVAQVAAEMGATKVTDCPGQDGGLFGVADVGTAYLGAERIGINVFPSGTLRDSWKAMSAGMGVIVVAQGTDWVAYKALSQTGTGCN
jgi:hypothetical protein